MLNVDHESTLSENQDKNSDLRLVNSWVVHSLCLGSLIFYDLLLACRSGPHILCFTLHLHLFLS